MSLPELVTVHTSLLTDLGDAVRERFGVSGEKTLSELTEIVKGHLPSVYEQVDYIESSGSQYIDLQHAPSLQTCFECDFAFTDLTVATPRNGGTYTNRSMFGLNGSNDTSANRNKWYIGLGAVNTWVGTPDTDRHTFKVDLTEMKGYIDGELSATGSYVQGGGFSTSLAVFAMFDGNGNAQTFDAKGKCYGVRLFNNNALIKKFVPCYRKSDKVIGMYDIINETFYTNAGSGSFTCYPSPT